MQPLGSLKISPTPPPHLRGRAVGLYTESCIILERDKCFPQLSFWTFPRVVKILIQFSQRLAPYDFSLILAKNVDKTWTCPYCNIIIWGLVTSGWLIMPLINCDYLMWEKDNKSEAVERHRKESTGPTVQICLQSSDSPVVVSNKSDIFTYISET